MWREWTRVGPTLPWQREWLMKLSARNQLKGKIIDVMKGATTSHVRIEIASGVIVTSSMSAPGTFLGA